MTFLRVIAVSLALVGLTLNSHNVASAASVVNMKPSSGGSHQNDHAHVADSAIDKICCEFDNFGKHRFECKLPAGCKMHGGQEVDDAKCGGCSGSKSHGGEHKAAPTRDDDDRQVRTADSAFDKICCEFDNFGEHRFECKLPAGCKMHGGQEVDDAKCGGCSGSESHGGEHKDSAPPAHTDEGSSGSKKDEDHETKESDEEKNGMVCCEYSLFTLTHHGCMPKEGCSGVNGHRVSLDTCGGC